MRSKFNLLEESSRVPLILSFPGQMPVNRVIHKPVSHLDIFSTILDYLRIPKQFDNSDGKSLRRYIEGTNYNEEYDEEVAVVELDGRIPLNSKAFDMPLGKLPNFSVRWRSYKLIITKKRGR